MKFVVLFVLAVAFTSTSARFLSKTKTTTVLAELDQNPIANMILSQMQIHLAAEGPVEDLMTLVQGFINDCNDGQAAADAQHASDVATCDSEISTAWANYEHHTDAHALAVQTIADTQDLLANAEAELEETIQNIADLTQWIAEGTALRATQAAAYAVMQARHQRALDALDEAIGLVGAMFASPAAFIQLQSKMESATNALKSLAEETDMFKPIVEALVQLTSEGAGSDAVKQILDLLVKLRQQIFDQKNDETATENDRIARWAQELSHLTNQRNNAVARKGTLENNIETYHQVIEANYQASEMHQGEADRYFDVHAVWVANCAEKQAAYDFYTAQNQGDLDVLTRLQDYLTDAFASVEDYIVDRVEA